MKMLHDGMCSIIVIQSSSISGSNIRSLTLFGRLHDTSLVGGLLAWKRMLMMVVVVEVSLVTLL